MNLRPTAPRQVTFRGTVDALGVVYAAPLTEGQRRTRVLRSWRPGTTVFRLTDGAYVVLRADPARIPADRADGQPIVRRHGYLMTAPLAADERPEAPAGALLRVQGGAVTPVDLSDDAQLVDPAQWLDPPLTVLTAQPLGVPPPPPKLNIPPKAVSLRKSAGLPPADADRMRAVARALEGSPKSDASAEAALKAMEAVGERPSRWRRTMIDWLQRLSRWLSARGLAPERPRDSGRRAPHRRPPDDRSPRPRAMGPSPLAQLMRSAGEWVARRAIPQLVGAWHQRYLDRLAGMFESGNLRDALRHAIPLGQNGGGEGRSALLPPTPRTRLDFGGSAPASTIWGGGGAWETLERLYRRAVDKLVAAGRYREAAFALGELLGQKHEAVAMLEREGQYTLAAELAEASDLSADLRVRLWAKAGEWDRALGLARRHDCFQAAIAHLKGADRSIRKTLHKEWARHRADLGDFIGAIELDVTADEVEPWLEAARRVGGRQGARALVMVLSRQPDRFGEVRAEIEALIADESYEAEQSRVALADSLVSENRTLTKALTKPQQEKENDADGDDDPKNVAEIEHATSAQTALAVLARPIARALICEHGRTEGGRERVRSLIRVANDPALQADLPNLRVLETPRTSSIGLRVEAADRGRVAIHDAARLPTGRLLLALGEAGVLFTTADGRPLAHMKVPATRVVPSDAGHRALALIQRGEVHQVHRIDLVRWKATTWCELDPGAFADTFDGWRWFAALGPAHRLAAVDVTGDEPQVEWQSSSPDPLLVTRAGGDVAMLRMAPAYVFERFDTARLQLARRNDVPLPDGLPGRRLRVLDFDTVGRALAAESNPDGGMPPWRAIVSGDEAVPLPFDAHARLIGGRLWDPRFAVVMQEQASITVVGLERGLEDPWLQLGLQGARHGGLRTGADRWVIWDDLGRVFVVDPIRKLIEQDFRARL